MCTSIAVVEITLSHS
uniref:Erm(A)L-1 n=4 Tax=Bacteria TaxID=2 RepID=A0A291L8D4_HAEIF|nr:uORF1 [Staphylococcus epidermidis]ATI14830.1 Erm(A)L-1 [Haemophilus influenzae]CAA26966.1 peptide 1 [Staphylococcus aureus]CAC20914.1 hypothetical protein [Staphylococcus intermedius]prf//1202257G peptide 1 [Staphylococcus aureus]